MIITILRGFYFTKAKCCEYKTLAKIFKVKVPTTNCLFWVKFLLLNELNTSMKLGKISFCDKGEGEQERELLKVRKRAKIRNRYNQIPHLTRDNVWESDKTQETITYRRAKRLVISQQVALRLQGTDMAVWQRQT